MEKDVLGFEVPMYDIIVMHKLKSIADLANDGLYFRLSQDLLPPQIRIEIARKTQFQHQVNVRFVWEKGVQLYDIGMIQVKLNLDLPHKLNDHWLVQYLPVDNFQRTYKIALQVFGHIHSSHLTLADLP